MFDAKFVLEPTSKQLALSKSKAVFLSFVLGHALKSIYIIATLKVTFGLSLENKQNFGSYDLINGWINSNAFCFG